MKKFYGTKEVNARPMNRLDYNIFRGWELPSDENGDDLGYLVESVGEANTEELEGYVNWLTKDQFDMDYNASGCMTFGEALVALKTGEKVARSGWNGKGMFIYHVAANNYPASGNKQGTMKGIFPDDMVPYQEYTAMKTADDTVVPWLCSQSDMWANDWEVVV